MQSLAGSRFPCDVFSVPQLKAFYVDLVAPMETNIEKDWRVVQAEHKRFTSHWRTLQESFGRAQVRLKKTCLFGHVMRAFNDFDSAKILTDRLCTQEGVIKCYKNMFDCNI